MNVGTLKYGVFERDGEANVHILQKSKSLFRVLDARRGEGTKFCLLRGLVPEICAPLR